MVCPNCLTDLDALTAERDKWKRRAMDAEAARDAQVALVLEQNKQLVRDLGFGKLELDLLAKLAEARREWIEVHRREHEATCDVREFAERIAEADRKLAESEMANK